MFYTVKNIKPLEKYTLLVTFLNGIVKTYDIKTLFGEIEVFNTLKDIPDLFEQVRIDASGYGISWNDEIDLSCDELWDNGNSITNSNVLESIAE